MLKAIFLAQYYVLVPRNWYTQLLIKQKFETT